MKVYGPKIKLLSDTQAGELVYLPDSERGGWAIVTSPKTNDAKTWLAIISPSYADGKVQHTSYSSAEHCASFGTNWCFEVVVDHRQETRPVKGPGRLGDWAVAHGDVGLTLHLDKDLKPFSLEKHHQLSGDAISGRFWRVWASETERGSPNAQPLVSSPRAPD